MSRRLGSKADEVQIEVRSVPGGFRGDLVLERGDRRLTRSIEAHTCAAVVDALALVTALDRADAEPDTLASEPDTPASEPPRPQPPAAPLDRAPHAIPRADRPASRDDPSAATQIAVGAELNGAFIVTTLIGGAVFGELALPSVLELTWLRPVMRAGLTQTFPAIVETDRQDRPRLQLTKGALDLCPVRATVDLGRSVLTTIDLCGRGELGSLSVGGDGEPTETRVQRLWLAGGGGPRVRVGARRGIFVEASALALAPLTRDRFHFASLDRPIQVASMIVTLGLAVGATLP